MKAEATFQEFVPSWVDTLDKSLYTDDGLSYPYEIAPKVWMANTEKIAEADLPKTMSDLWANPKLCGQYTVPTTFSGSTNRSIVASVLAPFKDDSGKAGISDEDWEAMAKFYECGYQTPEGETTSKTWPLARCRSPSSTPRAFPRVSRASTLSSRIAVFNNGYIEQVGTPREIYYEPVNEYVCTFIGEANKLTPEVIAHINELNPTQRLDPGHPTYVRAERVAMSPKPGVPVEDLIEIHGEFIDAQFYGATTQSSVDVAGSIVRSVQVGDRGLNKGDRGRMWIDPSDLMIFGGEA